MDCCTLETSVDPAVLLVSSSNSVIFIKSSFLVLRRFRFSICDLKDLGWKQRNRIVIDFVQASELSPLIFGFGLPFMSRLSHSFLECVIFPNGIHPGMFICPFSLFVFLVTIPFLLVLTCVYQSECASIHQSLLSVPFLPHSFWAGSRLLYAKNKQFLCQVESSITHQHNVDVFAYFVPSSSFCFIY
jgi:hypothetical protein